MLKQAKIPPDRLGIATNKGQRNEIEHNTFSKVSKLLAKGKGHELFTNNKIVEEAATEKIKAPVVAPTILRHIK